MRGRARRHPRLLLILASLSLLAVATAAYFLFRPTPRPDYASDPMDELFNYTLLTDEFNRLPIDQRLELLSQLIDRLKSMSSTDSALLAAFAASVEDEARRQLTENASRLLIDVWDLHARGYSAVPDEDRGAYLDTAFLEYTRMAEALAGESLDMSDSERLAEAREAAKRDEEMLKSGEGPTGEQLGRMFTTMWFDVGQHSSPQQRARGQLMMRDMARRLRGQDLPTRGG